MVGAEMEVIRNVPITTFVREIFHNQSLKLFLRNGLFPAAQPPSPQIVLYLAIGLGGAAAIVAGLFIVFRKRRGA